MPDLFIADAGLYHVTWTDEPCYVHQDGRIRPCRPPHDTIAARHTHDGRTYAGPDHEPLEVDK